MTEPLVSLTKQLIRYAPIEAEQINQAVAYCANWLESQGIDVKVLENQGLKMVVATIGQSGPTVVLNGHVDVVPGRPEDYVPRCEGGRIYGRGSNDMLGAVAAMMTAVAELSRQSLPCRVMLVLVPDEEKGGEKGTGYLVEQGYVGDFVICGEPTSLNISVQSKGVLQITLEVPGVSAHGSRPWLGQNAILRAFELYRDIEKLPAMQETSPFFPRTSLNLARIAGGNVINQVPDWCQMSLDIRYLPTQSPQEIIESIKRIDPEAKLTVHQVGAAVTLEPDNHFVRHLQTSVQTVSGREAVLFGQDGSADTRFYAAKGIAAVEFGPVGANHHGADEYVEIQSLCDYKEILKHFLFHLQS